MTNCLKFQVFSDDLEVFSDNLENNQTLSPTLTLVTANYI